MFAGTLHLRVGDTFRAQMADTSHRTLRVAATYERAAGLGDVIVSNPPAADGGDLHDQRPDVADVQVQTRDEYLAGLRAADNDDAWAVWMVIGLAALFTALALINTAAMATAERRDPSSRRSGCSAARPATPSAPSRSSCSRRPHRARRRRGVVAVSVNGVPKGLTGDPARRPVHARRRDHGRSRRARPLAALVATRIALRASPAEAMRTRET